VQVRWGPDNLDGYLNFFSISGDGRVSNWTLVKTALWCTDKLQLEYRRPLAQCDEMGGHLQEGARSIAFKPDESHLFLVGTEEGAIYLATTEYSSAHIMTYCAHTTPVNSLMWNTYYPSIFVSCAAEFVVHIWHMDFPSSIMRFDLGSQVGQVAWAPYSSTVFAAVTEEGKAVLYDLDINKYKPICNQKIVSYKVGVLNSIAFNNVEPLVIVGDSSGRVQSLKLSPNLRKKPKTKAAEEAIKNDESMELHKEEVIKLRKLLAQVVPCQPEEEQV
jgi:dynein intermediate chain 1